MAASTAKRRPRRTTAKSNALETKAIDNLETKDGGAAEEVTTKDTPNSAAEIKSLTEATEKLLYAVNTAGETKSDPLAEQGLSRQVAELHAALGKLQQVNKNEQKSDDISKTLEMMTEMKARLDSLETKGQRPPVGGEHSSMDRDDDVETKSDDDFDIEYKSAFVDYVRTGSPQSLRDLGEMEFKDMTSLSDPDGGYFVPEEIDREINGILLDKGGWRELCRIRSISGQSFKKRSRVKGVDAGWVGETDARERTGTPQYEEINLRTGELYARPAITQTLLEDSQYDLEGELAEEVAEAFELLENDAFIRGDGSKDKPTGILTYTMKANASVKSWGEFGFTLSGATDGIAKTNPGDEINTLIDFQHTLKAAYRGEASWTMTDLTMAYLRKIRDADGRPLLTTDTMTGFTSLLGKPIHIVHEWDEIGANKFAIGFGNWRKTYTIVDRLGSTMDRFYDSNTAPYVEFYTRKRLGGGVEFFDAAKFMKFAAS